MDLRKILEESKNIAVVGLSDKPERASYDVASYLAENGYAIFPVNPNISKWKGSRAYKSLSDISEKIDIVDIFRRSGFVPGIVDEAIRIGAKTVWMQLGVINEEAAQKAMKAGLNVVMNRCMKIEHKRLRR